MVGSSPRQPVQARSVATRAALLDAAVECLCADGYAAVTTPEIARRAGVSRGAQLHHFPTKAELLAAAVEHLFQRRLREFRDALADAAPLERVDAAVDVVWEMFRGPTFVAWVELWVAARTDAELAVAMAAVDRRFAEESRLMFIEVVADVGSLDPKTLEMARDFAFAVMTGVALQRLIPRGQRPASDHLDVLKAVLSSMMNEAGVAREA